MDGLTLLGRARAAGLRVEADGDKLVIRGPRSAEVLACELLAHKRELLPLLAIPFEEARFMRPCFMCGGRLFWRRIEDNAALCCHCVPPKDRERVVCLVEVAL